MLSITASGAYETLDRLGVPGLLRNWRNAAPVLCYHNVVPSEHPVGMGDASLHLPIDRFTEQVGWLTRHYDVVPLDTLVERLEHGESVRRQAAITFDDAYAGVFEYGWPVLKAHGLPATVFVVAGAAETGQPFWWDYPAATHADDAERGRWLSECRGDGHKALPEEPPPALPPYMCAARWNVIAAAVREGLAIGAHSMTHRALPTLTQREMSFEIVPCRGVITHRLKAEARIFAYPYGLFDDRCRDAVRAAGYTAAMALDPALNHVGGDRWAMPRINVPASLSAHTFAAWTAGLVPQRQLSA